MGYLRKFFCKRFPASFHLFYNAKTLFWLFNKMEQGFSCSTPAFRNTDILEGICRKKSNVICNLFPLGCGPQGQDVTTT